MRCADVMNTQVYTCSGQQTVTECARLMRDQKVNVVPVVDEKMRVKGVVTARDLVHRVLATDAGTATPLHEVMREVVTCQAWDCVAKLRVTLTTRARNTAVVIDDEGHCVGVISLSEVSIPDENLHVSEFYQGRPDSASARPA